MIKWAETKTHDGHSLFETTIEGFDLSLCPCLPGWIWSIDESETGPCLAIGVCLTRESAEDCVKAKLHDLLESE